MTRLRPDSPANRAAEEAADWLVLLEDDAGEHNRTRFLEWLRSSTLNVEEFLRLSALERRLRRHQPWPHDCIADLVAAATASDVALLPGAQRRKPSRRIYLAAAAVAVAVIGGSLLAFQSWRANEANTYITTIGEQRSVTLADGSIVELNSQSRLQTHYSDDERQVVLTQGEAIFRVAKNPQRPFRVRVAGTDIVAVGTAFNVNVRDTGTVVTVLEGRVRVSDHLVAAARASNVAAASPVELGQGEQAVIARDRGTASVATVDPIKTIAWTERRLIFDNTPLDTVAAEFARYHTRTIRLTTSSLKDRRITGVFDANDPASLIEFLRTDQAINVEADENGWRLSSSDLLIGTAAVEKK